MSSKRIVVALGGNALLRRGEPMTLANQRRNIAVAADALASVAVGRDLVVSHGNGPQVGLLALQSAAYQAVPAYPLDVLDAETQGMVGYLIEQELGHRLPPDRPPSTLLTMIEVDPADPAFDAPTKPIGPSYPADVAATMAATHGWQFGPDGDGMRRVVASPRPGRIVQLRQIDWLLQRGCVVICAGGGGIPVAKGADDRLVGVEAVIDKDHASGLLAADLGADLLVLATDAAGVELDHGTARARRVRRANPAALRERLEEFEGGSMRPKVEAACRFAESGPGRRAVIGHLDDIVAMVAGGGTQIDTAHRGIDCDGTP